MRSPTRRSPRAVPPDLLRAVRMVSAQKRTTIRLQWEAKLMRVWVVSDRARVEATIPVQAEGEGKVALQKAFLVDYLRGILGAVTMGYRDPLNPVQFRAQGVATATFMPIGINWGEDGVTTGEPR
ncbi:MAG: hypothetical protein ACK4K2_08935 [Dehalococcoidia bacterium]